MNKKLTDVAEIVAQANDLFLAKYSKVHTSIGIMDKALRKQGTNADAVTIDCIASSKRIVLLLPDATPNQINFAIGDDNNDLQSSAQLELNALTINWLFALMEANFL